MMKKLYMSLFDNNFSES